MINKNKTPIQRSSFSIYKTQITEYKRNQNEKSGLSPRLDEIEERIQNATNKRNTVIANKSNSYLHYMDQEVGNSSSSSANVKHQKDKTSQPQDSQHHHAEPDPTPTVKVELVDSPKDGGNSTPLDNFDELS